MKNKLLQIWVLLVTAMVWMTACKKFVTVPAPIDKIVTEKAFSSDEVATQALRGIYATMATNGFASGGPFSVTLLAGRSADEFTNQYTAGVDTRKQVSDNNIISTNPDIQTGLWTNSYQIIYAANDLLINVHASDNVSVATKAQLSAEAKFIRALSYFYLTNLFDRVPLILGTDYRVNSVAPQSDQPQIYAQIIKDLEEAKADLPDSYPTADRTRANKWAAIALLARVYLYTKDYSKAESYASQVIAKADTYSLITDDLNKVFLKNSSEAILQLFVPAANNKNTNEGAVFILTAAPTATTEVTLSDNLYSAFEPGDLRQSKWVGIFTSGTNKWYYPYKYKVKSGATPLNEYSMVLRLAEQYLIRAEALINQNKVDQGIADLNKLRSRARASASIAVPNPLPALPLGISQASALLAVENERRVELFSEWGHRWLDLKRTGRVNTVIGVLKGSNWQSTDALYPIPNSELINDPKLKQNPGY